jgi:hypothetical protein
MKTLRLLKLDKRLNKLIKRMLLLTMTSNTVKRLWMEKLTNLLTTMKKAKRIWMTTSIEILMQAKCLTTLVRKPPGRRI